MLQAGRWEEGKWRVSDDVEFKCSSTPVPGCSHHRHNAEKVTGGCSPAEQVALQEDLTGWGCGQFLSRFTGVGEEFATQ